MQIDKHFVFNRFPKTKHDLQLFADYKQRIGYGEKAPKALTFLMEETRRFPKPVWDAFRGCDLYCRNNMHHFAFMI